MQTRLLSVSFLVASIVLFPALIFANEPPLTYTNETYYTLAHEKPLSFTRDGEGGFYGLTENNRPFFQKNIVNGENIRLQRFEIDEAFFYISDIGIIEAPDNTAALSMYLAAAL